MRRTDRQRDAGFALEIIDRCAYGVAAKIGRAHV